MLMNSKTALDNADFLASAPLKMTKKEWDKVHSDFKGETDGTKYVLRNCYLRAVTITSR